MDCLLVRRSWKWPQTREQSDRVRVPRWRLDQRACATERSAKFRVQASDDHELVCDGCVILVVAPRTSMESRIAEKVAALGTKSDVDLVEDVHGMRVSLDSVSRLEPQIP